MELAEHWTGRLLVGWKGSRKGGRIRRQGFSLPQMRCFAGGCGLDGMDVPACDLPVADPVAGWSIEAGDGEGVDDGGTAARGEDDGGIDGVETGGDSSNPGVAAGSVVTRDKEIGLVGESHA